MSVSVLIKDSPARTPRAIEFVELALQAGYRVSQVFFYQAGVQHASGLSAERWVKLSSQHGLSLILCSASADHFGETGDTVFTIGGLGTLIEAGLESDKVISFG